MDIIHVAVAGASGKLGSVAAEAFRTAKRRTEATCFLDDWHASLTNLVTPLYISREKVVDGADEMISTWIKGAYLLYIIKGALHLKALVSRHFGLLDSYCPDGHIFAGAAGRDSVR